MNDIIRGPEVGACSYRSSTYHACRIIPHEEIVDRNCGMVNLEGNNLDHEILAVRRNTPPILSVTET